MPFVLRLSILLAALLGLSLLLVFVPALDRAVTERFFDGQAFPWRTHWLPVFLHDIVQPLALSMAALFVIMLVIIGFRRKACLGLSGRAVAFLLLTLIVGPGLLVNSVFKEHWDRARPLQTAEFGGEKEFSPAWVLSDQCYSNCSFVSGDAAFAFWFMAFAYVATQRRRRVLLLAMAAGVGISLVRIGMGSHYLSDTFFSFLIINAANAALYAALFGRQSLGTRWREWLGPEVKNGPVV